ncbi:Mrp/NBP35 family ATP-binding protein [Methanofollis fontis]|uniref:Iron-sulfur cluster carrier protein n=1 Tax=Methanofollis fontis TaxID=2052832 RepID=A0A483CUF9_9EURY|nr:Mrp/NBP35 family ATP-binding protein [Methanofollis fontis]TAJ44954.1 ATP-binding protein [Methanofollis fontis]
MAENGKTQEECSGNCATCSSAQKEACDSPQKGLPPKAKIDVEHVILVLSGKGGVGKTTVSVNLASALAKTGKSVGLLDLDIHGPNVPKMVGAEGQKLMVMGDKIEPIRVTGTLSVVSMEFLLPDADTPVIWRGPMKMSAIKQFLEDVNWGPLDYLVVDLPPGTGDEALTIVQLAPNIEGAVIVTTPQEVSTMDSKKAANFVEKLDLPVLGVIENMSGLICPDCGKEIEIFGKGGGEKAAQELGVPFLGAIPIDPEVRKAGDEGRPFINLRADSPSWKAIDTVMENLVKLVEG